MNPSFQTEFSEIVRARFPLIYLQTFEEDRAIQTLEELCANSGKTGLSRPLYLWSQVQGLRQYPNQAMDASLRSPHCLFDQIENAKKSTSTDERRDLIVSK